MVLLDGVAIITRTEVSISLKHGRKILCHSAAARRSEWVARMVMCTYVFLVFFCVDAPGLYTLCAFDGSRLE